MRSEPSPFAELLVAFRDGHAEYGGGGGFEVFAVPSAQANEYFSSAACGYLGSFFVRESKGTKSLDCHAVFGNFRTRDWTLTREVLNRFADLACRAGGQLPLAAQEQLSAKQNDPASSWLAFMWVHSPPVDNQFHGRRVWSQPFLDAANAMERGGLCTDRRPTARPSEPTDPDAHAVNDDSHLSPVKLAEAFGVPAEPLRLRLKRWQKKNLEGWIENDERKPREARYLYRVGAVRHIIEDLQATSQATSERPAKKK